MAKKAEAERAVAAEENAIVRYFRETRGELRKVTWPTRDEAIRLTAIVLGVTLVAALFFWAVDALFANTIQAIINWLIGL